MSRITRAPVSAGQTITATDLNGAYSDFNQPGALNADNTRDQAFDLPHFQNVVIVKNSQVDILGNAGMQHTAPLTTCPSSTAWPPTLHPVQNSVGNQTLLSFGANGWSCVLGDCLRVWWNLSVYPQHTGNPPNTVGALGRYTVPDTAVGTVILSDGFHCWLAYLEWDITSNALANFVPVPGQVTPVQNVGGTGQDGIAVQSMNGSTTISAWVNYSFGAADEGRMPPGNDGSVDDHGWFAAYGMYVTPFIGATTVYGIRLVLTGILHPYNDNTNNYLVYDYVVGGANQKLEYKGGRISAVQMRVS